MLNVYSADDRTHGTTLLEEGHDQSHRKTRAQLSSVASDEVQYSGKGGLLQPIAIPKQKLDQITTYLVTDVPPSKGYTVATIFVDRLTKISHFAPSTKEIAADQYAQRFVHNLFRLRGMPEVIIPGRSQRFKSSFWTQPFHIIGTDLRLSSEFHPEIDGQSEVTIRVLENL